MLLLNISPSQLCVNDDEDYCGANGLPG